MVATIVLINHNLTNLLQFIAYDQVDTNSKYAKLEGSSAMAFS